MVVETGIALDVPSSMHISVFAIPGRSPREPTAAPGICDSSNSSQLRVLLFNPSAHHITVKRHQIVATFRLCPNKDIIEVYYLGELDELGLPVEKRANAHSVLAIIPRESLTGLTEEEKDKFLKLVEEFCTVFAKNADDFGCTIGVKHTVDTGDHAPISQRSYRQLPRDNAVIGEKVQKLLDAGLLKPSSSPWASPLLLVKKKDGINRVVIDSCRPNSITKKDKYPLPRIDDTLDRLGGAKYFSAMDLLSGYWKIPMDEEDQQKFALITTSGLFQPLRMPQGLANAPATFQRFMDVVFAKL